MELIYQGKQPAGDILERARQVGERIATKESIEQGKNLFLFGDNFNALALLLYNGYRSKVDLVYIDPPYNTQQVFNVAKNNRTSTISRVKHNTDSGSAVAYNDRFSDDEYCEFMRERLILLRELLSEQGSIYVHIDNKMGFHLKLLLDEIFGVENFCNDIARVKTNPKNFSRRAYGNEKDMILFYAKNSKQNIFNNIAEPLSEADTLRLFKKIDKDGRRYTTVPCHAPGETLNGDTGKEWKGQLPPAGRHWRMSPSELDKLDEQGLIEWSKNNVPRIKHYADEHKGKKLQDIWNFKDPSKPTYPTEKNATMLEMIIAQSSNPNSIVLDCFAGSGSTLKAANKLGRRWIGVDQSPVSLEIVQQNLSSAEFQVSKLSEVEK